MISTSKLISELQLLTKTPVNNPALKEVRIIFLPPTLHVDLISDSFQGLNEEDRLEKIYITLLKNLNTNKNLLESIISKLPININLLTLDEAAKKAIWLGSPTASSWVNWFLKEKPIVNKISILSEPHYIHFYGYKGGQARSSVLALFGKLLADDGYKVLAIDADTEAPSLDSLLGSNADRFSQTLMGLCGWSNEFEPVPAAYVGQHGKGRIDVLPCRPRNEDYDLDFALFVATAPLDARIYERAASKLRSALSSRDESYDFVLIDHRTGIATSVLPLVGELPGPTVVFVRVDSNTLYIPSEMKKVIRSIFENSGDNPGAFISFSLDSNRKSGDSVPALEARARTELLEELAQSMSRDTPDFVEKSEQTEEGISAEEMEFNWVEWYLDRALLDSTLPDISKLQIDNVSSLRKLRDVLGLPIQKKAAQLPELNITTPGSALSLSGARDSGAFIHIPDIERLFIKGSPITYILGRKGTGKTRLLKELVLRNMGTPLVVAAEETNYSALRSQSIEANEWVSRTNDPRAFWWSIIQLALQSTESLSASIKKAVEQDKKPSDFASPLGIKNYSREYSEQKVFLIDGLETLVPAEQIKAYVAGLFSVMNTVQNDPFLSSKLLIRAFLREDLSSDSVQNIEQQMEGRVLRLKWSASSILNFAVSRLPSLNWIKEKFPDVIKDIELKENEIQQSALSEQNATEILLRVFPEHLKRNNLLTSTFLRLYFSDAGGDSTNMATFYPRLYLYFLQKLDGLAQSESNSLTGNPPRLDSILLNRAYDHASTTFIEETKQELVHLLSLNIVDNKNLTNDSHSNVTQFITAFDGVSTPFVLEKLVIQLKEKTKFTEQSIRESLQRMKTLRMFEERPGFPGSWRVGQLYKMGLRMKYARQPRL